MTNSLKSKTSDTTGGYACGACGHSSLQWFGRCPRCGEWSSAVAPSAALTDDIVVTSLVLAEAGVPRIPTGSAEIDRVLGGGLVRGEVVLLAGEPGIGKSTLVLQLINGLISGGYETLLVSGEESVGQVSLRGARLGVHGDRFRVAASTSLSAILALCDRESPTVLVVDSIQTLEDPSLDQSGGSAVQVRECAASLVRYAKATGTIVVLVGHVTKEGSVAGPKTLEHVVDAVVALEGERGGALRVLRAAKNRFGSCDETGVFVMGERGLEAVSDPSAMLLADRYPGVAGSVVFPGLEGSRPLLLDIQALVYPTDLPHPRRVALGLESKRLALLLGVLAQRAQLELHRSDVFVSAAGGLTVREPAADLAICLSLFSAARDAPVDQRIVAIGEVGLGGEVRRVPGIERRLREAARLGFEQAIVPQAVTSGPRGIRLRRAGNLLAALELSTGKPERGSVTVGLAPRKAGR